MKKFDSVNMMREILDNLSKKYIDKPELENKELEEIQKNIIFILITSQYSRLSLLI